MRNLSLITAILGLFFIITYLFLSKPVLVEDYDSLALLEQNKKVITESKVIEEYTTSNSRVLTLENNITIICKCSNLPKLIDKNISVVGTIDNYQEIKLKALKLKW